MATERIVYMKNLKYSIKGQMLLITKAHLRTALLFMILFLFTFSMNSKTKDVIFAIFGTLGYFLSMYSAGNNAYLNDKKSISPLTPKAAKGFILPLILTLSNLLIFILYRLAWTVGFNGQSLEIWAVIVNVITILWTSPFHAPYLVSNPNQYQSHLLGMSSGTMSIHGYLIILLIPIIASGVGYFAAYKGFDLNAKMHSLAYEKKKDKREF